MVCKYVLVSTVEYQQNNSSVNTDNNNGNTTKNTTIHVPIAYESLKAKEEDEKNGFKQIINRIDLTKFGLDETEIATVQFCNISLIEIKYDPIVVYNEFFCCNCKQDGQGVSSVGNGLEYVCNNCDYIHTIYEKHYYCDLCTPIYKLQSIHAEWEKK